MLKFDYLNQNDGFVIDIFVEKKEEGAPWSQAAELRGEIIGAVRPPVAINYSVGAHYMFPIFVLFMGIVGLVGECIIVPDWWVRSPHWSLNIGLAVLSVGIALGALFMVAQGLKGISKTVPLNLIVAGEDVDGVFAKFVRIFKMPD